jgi:ABC-type microcin C transport system permease subunit YejE
VRFPRAEGVYTLSLKERFLLAGDIEQEIDPILLARGLPRVDFLKIAHHGSWNGTPQGAILAVGRNYVASAWWIATLPGLCLFVLVLTVNLLGDQLRDRLDPRAIVR